MLALAILLVCSSCHSPCVCFYPDPLTTLRAQRFVFSCGDSDKLALCTASYGSTALYRGVQRLQPLGDYTVIGGSGDISDFQRIKTLLTELKCVPNPGSDILDNFLLFAEQNR